MNKAIIEKAGKIIASRTGAEHFCTMAQIDLDGFPTAAAVSASKTQGIEWLTFCTGLKSNKALRVEKDNRASICFNDTTYNITLVGRLEILTDEETKKDMWYEGLANHFSGVDDPNYCVLRFVTERYSLLVDWVEVAGVV